MSVISSTSFKTFCISASIFIILINLSINLVIGLGIFPSMMTEPVQNTSVSNVTGNATQVASGDFFSYLFSLELGLGSIIGLGVSVWAARSGSWNVAAATIFSVIFWSAWINNLFIIEYASDLVAVGGIYGLLTVPMIFIYAGATIGILGGSE